MQQMIQLDWRAILTLVCAFGALIFGFGRVLLVQFDRRMQDRFAASAALRAEEIQQRDARLAAIEAKLTHTDLGIDQMQRTLPLDYVRREDWIRFASTIDAKLDRLSDQLNTRNRGL